MEELGAPSENASSESRQAFPGATEPGIRVPLRPQSSVPESAARLLSPAKAFAVVLAGAVVTGAAFYLIAPREEPPSAPTSAATPDLSLTDAEAIARLEELNELRFQAFENRDLTLLAEIYTPDSSAARIARKEIRGLLDDLTLSRMRYETKQVRIVRNTPLQIELRHVVIVYPRFVHERTRKDLTGPTLKERWVEEWVLRPVGTRWLVYDGEIVEATTLRRKR